MKAILKSGSYKAVATHYYAWNNSNITGYTLSETPSAGDAFYHISGSSTAQVGQVQLYDSVNNAVYATWQNQPYTFSRTSASDKVINYKLINQ